MNYRLEETDLFLLHFTGSNFSPYLMIFHLHNERNVYDDINGPVYCRATEGVGVGHKFKRSHTCVAVTVNATLIRNDIDQVLIKNNMCTRLTTRHHRNNYIAFTVSFLTDD